MFPVPREFTSAREIRAEAKAVRDRLKSLPAWTPPPPPPEAPPLPPPIPATLAPALVPIWKPTSTKIRDMIARHYGLTVAQINCRSHRRKFSRPRMIAYYLCARYTGLTYPQIGMFFAGRDHSTIVHGVQDTRRRIAADSDLAATVAEFVRQIEGWSTETGGT